MADTSTKAIACRVPIQDYIAFLSEASGKKMNISDWLLMRIYSDEPISYKQKAFQKQIEAKDKEITKLERQVAELTREREELKKQHYEQIHELSTQVDKIYQYAKRYDKDITIGHMMNYIHELFPNAIFD